MRPHNPLRRRMARKLLLLPVLLLLLLLLLLLPRPPTLPSPPSRIAARATGAIAPNRSAISREREGRPQARERRGGERPDRDRQDRGPRRDKRDFKDRDRGEAREWLDPKERRGQADPNSPFAKLAALKEQLEAGKDGR